MILFSRVLRFNDKRSKESQNTDETRPSWSKEVNEFANVYWGFARGVKGFKHTGTSGSLKKDEKNEV